MIVYQNRFWVNFSYNSDLSAIKKRKIYFLLRGLEEILRILFKDEDADFTILDDQVIIFSVLTPTPEISIQQKSTHNLTIKGIITDSISHSALPFAHK